MCLLPTNGIFLYKKRQWMKSFAPFSCQTILFDSPGDLQSGQRGEEKQSGSGKTTLYPEYQKKQREGSKRIVFGGGGGRAKDQKETK